MERIDALVATAHRRLRLRRMLIAIERNPRLLEGDKMTPKFKGLGAALAKLQHDLDAQAAPLMADIEALSSEAPGLLRQAVEHVAATKQAVADIKGFVNALGSNGGPSLTDSPDSSGASVAQPSTADQPATQAQAEPAASWSKGQN